MTNVVLVLADDLGYSDLGCYGGEIRTPNLDAIGRSGVRFSNFYNTARCSPSRASLLTGLHPHQTGIGVLTSNDTPRGYLGSLNDRCATTAEILGAAGYATGMSGKWHLSSEVHTPCAAWPTRRGFDHFFGTLTGCGSYYAPGTLTRGERDASAEFDTPGFFYTDAITTDAVEFVHRSASQPHPFFLYVAYTAPHWPLHAPEADIDSYQGTYDDGWDALRKARLGRLVREGILPEDTELTDRDPTQPPWSAVTDQRWEARRMQTYAAMVERMDRGIGRLRAALEETGQWENTLFVFLSDNGASAEDIGDEHYQSLRNRPENFPGTTRSGEQVFLGNHPESDPGPEDTYASYGTAWANLSNTPFRRYKRWTHEGGIAAPCIVHWPHGGLAAGTVQHAPFQLVDVLPTVLEAAGVDYPQRRQQVELPPLQGVSMLPALRGAESEPHTLFWEHTGNTAVRDGQWKLVREHSQPWELYDVHTDRSELHDLAAERPDLVSKLEIQWEEWASRVGVLPWDDVIALYRERGQTSQHANG
ncbi:arylsulfatase [Saccharopolyspora phatthalungensis]|uniref:Arylsulfatase n=1 Tax=Saccharopolyspora phatthalungensis TaxID=664693 RepID=A0A840Q7S9_9PSEU|nr:arylsulfatase [Saccharopolyspora phatthalungensis]MBB5156506.1 arylsulfatase [Saccharopolyspora phatthalungensis]